MKSWMGFWAGSLLTLVPCLAAAQERPWLADRTYAEGIGVRIGHLELHPGIAAEVGYDSNFFQRSGDTDNPGESPVLSAYRLRLTPSVSLSTLGERRRESDGPQAQPPSVTFRASLFGSYNELLGEARDADQASKRFMDAGLHARLDVLPKRPWSGDLTGDYVRTVQASNDPAGESSWDRDTVHGGAGVSFRPGGGLFEWRFVGYDFTYNYFESDRAEALTNKHHKLGTRAKWLFLPRTALIGEADTTFIRYTFMDAPRNDGQTYRVRGGLHGLVTDRFTVTALVGWGGSAYDATATEFVDDYSNVIVQSEVKYYLLPNPTLEPKAAAVGLSHIALGYLRDFNQSYIADYYRRDRGYLRADYFFAGQFLLDVQAGYSRINHPRFERGGELLESKKENRIDLQGFTEYRLSDSFGVNLTLRYDASLTDVTIPLAATVDAGDNLAFSRCSGWLGARYFL